jgi:hypothetical protein
MGALNLRRTTLIFISGGAVLWQKERLLNLAIKSVPLYVKTLRGLTAMSYLTDPIGRIGQTRNSPLLPLPLYKARPMGSML